MSGVDFDALRNMDAFVKHISQNHSETADAILASADPDAAIQQAAAAVAVSPERAMEEDSDSDAPAAAPSESDDPAPAVEQPTASQPAVASDAVAAASEDASPGAEPLRPR